MESHRCCGTPLDVLLLRAPFRYRERAQFNMHTYIHTYIHIGPPQSGKSSLLRYISGRLGTELHPDSKGELLFNGHEVQPELLPRIVGYVPQTDQHAPSKCSCICSCICICEHAHVEVKLRITLMTISNVHRLVHSYTASYCWLCATNWSTCSK